MHALRLVLLAVLLVAPAFAGCLDVATDAPQPAATTQDAWSGLSAPDLLELVKEHVPVEAPDGKMLDAWVFRPATDEPVPVIINFSPYWGNLAPGADTGGDAFGQYLLDFFVPRGYAVVLTSVRGTGYSEGCFNIGGESERKDAVAVIEHFADQPWSNGHVAAAGKSYDGTVPQAALVEAPDALKTIVPVSAISEFYKYNYVNGLPYTQGPIFNTYYYAGVAMDVYGDPKTDQPALIVDDVACADTPFVQGHGVASGVTGDYTDYWQERNYSALAGNAKASVFFVHGLADWNVKPDHMNPWIHDLYASGVTIKQWLGQWAHDYPTRDDFNLTLLKWFDHYLKGEDTGILDEPLVQVEDNRGVWRHEDEWPPARAESVNFYLAQDGTLHADPQDEGVAVLVPDVSPEPRGPVFETDPLTEDLRYAGTPTLRVDVTHTAPKGQLTWVLYDVAPSGDATPINFGYYNYAHRDSLEMGKPVVPGERFALSIPGYPQDDVIPAGHTLRLEITPQARLDLDVGPAVLTTPSGGITSLHLGESAHFSLPVLPNADLRFEDPQPEDIGCWAC